MFPDLVMHWGNLMVNNCLEDGQLILEWAVKVCALTLE